MILLVWRARVVGRIETDHAHLVPPVHQRARQHPREAAESSVRSRWILGADEADLHGTPTMPAISVATRAAERPSKGPHSCATRCLRFESSRDRSRTYATTCDTSCVRSKAIRTPPLSAIGRKCSV